MDAEARYLAEQRRAAFGCLLTSVGLFLICLVGGTAWLRYELSPPSDRRLAGLKAEGNEIVRQLEAYKAQHRMYPPDLKSAGIVPPKHDQGNWDYWVFDNGSRYSLSIRHNGRLKYDRKEGWSFRRSDSSD